MKNILKWAWHHWLVLLLLYDIGWLIVHANDVWHLVLAVAVLGFVIGLRPNSTSRAPKKTKEHKFTAVVSRDNNICFVECSCGDVVEMLPDLDRAREVILTHLAEVRENRTK